MFGFLRRQAPAVPPPRIAFCTPSKGRLAQLSQTAEANIRAAMESGIDFEFVYVDLDCPDGVGEWIRKHLRPYAQHVRLYRAIEPVPVYSIPRADNTAMKLASAPVVSNLMADNFVFPDYFRQTARHIARGEHVFVRNPRDYVSNTVGLLTLYKSRFLALGGYDEALSRWGYQEVDLRNRAEKMGMKMLTWPAAGARAIRHDDTLRTKFSDTDDAPRKSNLENREKSRQNVQEGRLVANAGAEWGDIRVEPVPFD